MGNEANCCESEPAPALNLATKVQPLEFHLLRCSTWPIKHSKKPNAKNLPYTLEQIFRTPEIATPYSSILKELLKQSCSFSDLSIQAKFWSIQAGTQMKPLYEIFPAASMDGAKINSSQVSIEQSDTGKMATTSYLLATVLMAIANPETIHNIVMTIENTLGFHLLRFMCNGLPHYLPIDDTIPLGKEKLPAYLQLTDSLWPLVIEKAWAKITGGYESPKPIFPHEIYEEITGAPGEVLLMKDYSKDIFFNPRVKVLLQACDKMALCSKVGLAKSQVVLVEHAFKITEPEMQKLYGNILLQVSVPYRSNILKSEISKEHIQVITGDTPEQVEARRYMTETEMTQVCSEMYLLHSNNRATRVCAASPSSCNTYWLTVKHKGLACLKLRQYFSAYTNGKGHKYSPVDVIVWDNEGRTIRSSEVLQPGSRSSSIFRQDFEQLEPGVYIIRVDASWALVNPESRLVSLTLFADESMGCRLELLDPKKSATLLESALIKNARTHSLGALKTMIDQIKFDQGWIGTLGYLYVINEGELSSTFKIHLKNCKNITFMDTDKDEKNKTYNVEIAGKKDTLLLYRQTDCVQGVQIGELTAEYQA